MSENHLISILRSLHRQPCSQAQLGRTLKFSKSYIHKLVQNLLIAGLIEKSEGGAYEQEQGRPRQDLRICRNIGCYAVLVIHTSWMFRVHLYRWGASEATAIRNLPQQDNCADFAEALAGAVEGFVRECLKPGEKILAVVIATQATLEQGEHGLMYRNNLLKDEKTRFSDFIAKRVGIRTFAYNYAYGLMLSLLHSGVDISFAMVLSCGEGSVALGFFLNHKVLLGVNNSFPECSHLPFKYGLEKSLGFWGPHTEEALFFAISAIAPIYNLQRVYVAGTCFDEHPEVIRHVSLALRNSADPVLRDVVVEYRNEEIQNYFQELVYLSFDAVAEVLNPQMHKRPLQEFLDEHTGQSGSLGADF